MNNKTDLHVPCSKCGNVTKITKPTIIAPVSDIHAQILLKAPIDGRFTIWGNDAVLHVERGHEKAAIIYLEEFLAKIRAVLIPQEIADTEPPPESTKVPVIAVVKEEVDPSEI